MASPRWLLWTYEEWLEAYKDSLYLKVEREEKWPEIYQYLRRKWKREVLMDLRYWTQPELF